jgi:hypothetical protein
MQSVFEIRNPKFYPPCFVAGQNPRSLLGFISAFGQTGKLPGGDSI